MRRGRRARPFFTGIVYCNVIGTCLEIADVRRADEWSEAARAWCESLPPESPFPGMCRVNRAEVARLRGAWSEAEAEATRASEELMGFDPDGAAQAFYETGEIRRRMGNLAGAEECFARARRDRFRPATGAGAPPLRARRRGGGARRRSGVRVHGQRRAGSSARGSSPRSWTWRSRVPDLDAAAGAARSAVGARRRLRRPDPAGDGGDRGRRRAARPGRRAGRRRQPPQSRCDVARATAPVRGGRARMLIRARAPRGRRRG